MKAPPKGLMLEPGAVSRGLVPNSTHGILDKTFNAYLDELDPKGESDKSEAVREALAQSGDSRFNEFLQRIYLPHYRKHSLASVAKECGISLAQFAEFWQKSQNVRALSKVQDGIVNIAGDMISDARSKKISCDRCDGWGWVFVGENAPHNPEEVETFGEKLVRRCPVCDGERKLNKPGDTESRKLLLEMAGHTGKRGGGVNIIQNFTGAGIESAVQKLSAVTFDVEAEEVIE